MKTLRECNALLRMNRGIDHSEHWIDLSKTLLIGDYFIVGKVWGMYFITCPDCNGWGVDFRYKIRDEWAPQCTTCNGMGSIPD